MLGISRDLLPEETEQQNAVTNRIKLVYITSPGHSGSTLLDLLIGSHDQAVSVGELRRFRRRNLPQCACGAPTVWTCPFWNSVNEEFLSAMGVPLRKIEMDSPNDDEFVLHNRALLNAIATVSGKNIIVESSKYPRRLKRLLKTRTADIYPVHLMRRPQGVVYSHIKKGRSWKRHAIDYAERHATIRRVLRNHAYLTLRYEDLATRPSESLSRIMTGLGLDFDPVQLDWTRRVQHNCGGNRILLRSESEIRIDTEWQSALPLHKKLAIGALARTGHFIPW